MPLVRPLHQLIFLIPVPLLSFADELLVIPFDLLQVVIGKHAPLLFQFAFELFPFSLELIGIHDVSFLRENVCPSGPVPPHRVRANSDMSPDGDLVTIAQCARNQLP
jgi:hypothetical protein